MESYEWVKLAGLIVLAFAGMRSFLADTSFFNYNAIQDFLINEKKQREDLAGKLASEKLKCRSRLFIVCFFVGSAASAIGYIMEARG